MQVRLTRVRGGVKLPSESLEGEAERVPTVGRSFVMTAPALDPEYDGRFVSTSTVVAVDGIEFETRSGSRYRLEVIDFRIAKPADA